MAHEPTTVSAADRVLDHRGLQQGTGDEAVALGALDEIVGFVGREVCRDLEPDVCEAQPFVVSVHAHRELTQLHVTLARHVRDGQCEARGKGGEEQLRRGRPLVVATGGWRFVGEDLEVADAHVRAVAPPPVGEEGLVSHGQRRFQR